MEKFLREPPQNNNSESLITLEPAQEIPMRGGSEWDEFWWNKGKDWGTLAGLLANKNIYKDGEETAYATLFILPQRKHVDNNPLGPVDSVRYMCGVQDNSLKRNMPIDEALPILKENLAGIFKFTEENT